MGDHHHHKAEGNLRAAFLINLLFTVIEIIGGIYTNSLAILSDAVHDLGDSLSLGLALYFQKLGKKERNEAYSYGYRRFPVLGALINASVLITGSTVLLVEAVPALFNPRVTNPEGMFILAIFGVAFNFVAYLKIHRGTSLNEKVVSLHLLEDVLGWVAVLLGSLVMIFWDLPFIDPLLSVLISTYVIYNAVRSLIKGMKIFLQGTPDDIQIKFIRSTVLELEEVVNVHDCHVWTMDGEHNILSMHVICDKNYSLEEQSSIKLKIKELLQGLRILHCTIEFEIEGEGSGQANKH